MWISEEGREKLRLGRIDKEKREYYSRTGYLSTLQKKKGSRNVIKGWEGGGKEWRALYS